MVRLRQDHRTPWWLVFGAMHTLQLGDSYPVVFECVGAPGTIDRIVEAAPLMSQVIVAVVCLEADSLHPFRGIGKELDIRFSTDYDPAKYSDTLHMLADGTVEPGPVVTGSVGLYGVDDAFTTLGDPEHHAKVLIDPLSNAVTPSRRSMRPAAARRLGAAPTS